MRKSEREIKDFDKIIDIIKNTNTIRLGLNDEPYPYVVPVSFGYDVKEDKLSFYFHGATIGKKVDLINKNPLVCVEGDIFYRYMDTIKSVTCLYDSFIAYGKCVKLTGNDAIYGLKQILDHCNYKDHPFNTNALSIVNVYKIEIDSITAKHRTKNN